MALITENFWIRSHPSFFKADMTETLREIINKLWIAPENAEWTPRTDTLELGDIRRWSKSEDIVAVSSSFL